MQARAGEVRPIGTAVPVETFALVELPLPWPAHIEEHPTLAGVAEVLAPLDARVQGVVPSAEATASGQYQVTLLVRPPGPFRRYERVERSGALNELLDTCRSLVTEAEALRSGGQPEAGEVVHAAGDEVSAGPTEAGQLVHGAPAEVAAEERVLLVCTHGARDRCCGSMGTVAFASVDQRPDLRLGRTSHLGGHRFAPTAALLPEGTVWAWLDGPALATILDRTAPVASVIDRYRGSSGMAGPAVQAAEAAVFAEVGWMWLDATRAGEIVEAGDDRWSVRIDSSIGTWSAEVVSHGEIAQPTCGSDEPSTKTDPQLEVVSLTRGS
jgi:hypothetical protein